MRKLTPLFSIPVLQTDLTLTKKFNDFIVGQERKLIKPAKNGLGSTDTYILNHKNCSEIKKKILKEIDYFKDDILCVKKHVGLYIKNSWVMYHENNHFAESHFHVNSFLSGILYIKTPPNSGNIVFHSSYANLSLLPLINIPFEKYNEHNSSTWTFPLSEGRLLIFPSSLRHSVPSNLSFDTRICLSFNVLMKGDLKDCERSHLLLT